MEDQRIHPLVKLEAKHVQLLKWDHEEDGNVWVLSLMPSDGSGPLSVTRVSNLEEGLGGRGEPG